MFTKVVPAGNLFIYVTGAKDSMDRVREEIPMRLRGNPTSALRVLKFQAPAGVAPRGVSPRVGVGRRKRPHVRRRNPAEWVRHCQAHLVHFISCFHEGRDQVTDQVLKRITRGTEDLVLAGLPRDALHFTWYKHGQEIGTHAHGALLLTLLPKGQAYEPKLNYELKLHFDRLASRHFGLADPLNPRAFRPVYAAWGSWKEENEVLITQVCRKTLENWNLAGRNGSKEFKLEDFEKVLADFGLEILAKPGDDGTPIKQKDSPAGLSIPLYRNTITVEASDPPRTICFKGPICRPKFDDSRWRNYIQNLEKVHKEDPAKIFDRFRRLLEERIFYQSNLLEGAGKRVGLKEFAWLDPKNWIQSNGVGAAEVEVDPLSDQMIWEDRHFPFAVDREPNVKDICSPNLDPLRELIQIEMLSLPDSAFHEDEIEGGQEEKDPVPAPVPMTSVDSVSADSGTPEALDAHSPVLQKPSAGEDSRPTAVGGVAVEPAAGPVENENSVSIEPENCFRIEVAPNLTSTTPKEDVCSVDYSPKQPAEVPFVQPGNAAIDEAIERKKKRRKRIKRLIAIREGWAHEHRVMAGMRALKESPKVNDHSIS